MAVEEAGSQCSKSGYTTIVNTIHLTDQMSGEPAGSLAHSEFCAWTPGPVVEALQRALDVEDLKWTRETAGWSAAWALRRRRSRVVSLCASELRGRAFLLFSAWRRSAAARGDYSRDPLVDLGSVVCLLWAVRMRATWSITLGLPKPAASAKLISRLQAAVAPLALVPRPG